MIKPKKIPRVKKPIFAGIKGMNWLVLERQFNLAMSLGFTIAIPVVVGVIGGLFLDNKVGVRPFFTLVFSLLGTIIGIYGAIKFIRESL